MEKMSDVPLEVCVCGATQERFGLLLHTLAGGQVLGPNQLLKVTLQDKPYRADELVAVAEDLTDACYSLVTDIQSECNLNSCIASCDIVLLLLEHDDLQKTLEDTCQYAGAFNNTMGTKFKVVIVVGQKATTAAAVMNVLCPHLNPRLLIAVDVAEKSLYELAQHGGAFQMAQAVSKTVRASLTTTQKQDSTTIAVSSSQCNDIPLGCVLPLSLTMMELSNAQLDGKSTPSWPKMKQAVEDFQTSVSYLSLSEADLLASALFSKL